MLTQSSVSRAIELLDLALVEQPNSALAHMLSAEAHLLRGDKVAARRSFELAEPKTASEDGRHAKLKDRMAELIGA